MIFTRATGTPMLRAAFGSPPTAKIQLPKRVLSSTQVATAVTPIHQSTDAGTPGTAGSPSGRSPTNPISPSQRNRPPKALPAKRSTIQLPFSSSGTM